MTESADASMSDSEPAAAPEKIYAIHVRDDRAGLLKRCCPVCMLSNCPGRGEPHRRGENITPHSSLDARATHQATGSGRDLTSTLCFRCKKPGYFAPVRRPPRGEHVVLLAE